MTNRCLHPSLVLTAPIQPAVLRRMRKWRLANLNVSFFVMFRSRTRIEREGKGSAAKKRENHKFNCTGGTLLTLHDCLPSIYYPYMVVVSCDISSSVSLTNVLSTTPTLQPDVTVVGATLWGLQNTCLCGPNFAGCARVPWGRIRPILN